MVRMLYTMAVAPDDPQPTTNLAGATPDRQERTSPVQYDNVPASDEHCAQI